MTKQLLVYGANGYTGELTVNLAAGQGCKPIVAGHTVEKSRHEPKDTAFRLARLRWTMRKPSPTTLSTWR